MPLALISTVVFPCCGEGKNQEGKNGQALKEEEGTWSCFSCPSQSRSKGR
jgi:hypothetical protein